MKMYLANCQDSLDDVDKDRDWPARYSKSYFPGLLTQILAESLYTFGRNWFFASFLLVFKNCFFATLLLVFKIWFVYIFKKHIPDENM